MKTPLANTVFGNSLARLRAWYEGSLVNRVALKAQLLMALILLGIASLTYPLVLNQVRDSVNERLSAVASLSAQRLEFELDRILLETENLAKRSLVANGLADSAGSNAYLRPYLHEYRREFPEMLSISLVDGMGQSVASSDVDPVLNAPMLRRVAESEKAEVSQQTEGGLSRLQIAFPVKYLATGRTEGVLTAELDLRRLVERVVSQAKMPDSLPLAAVIVDAAGKEIYRTDARVDGEDLSANLGIGGILNKHGAPLTLTVITSKTDAYAPVTRVAVTLVLLALVSLVIIMVLTQRMSETIIRPLGEMSHRAMEIAGAGPSGLRELPVTRSDEIGWMGTAFNEMVYSLRQAYATQEEQVRRRTVELAEAREQLAGVLAGIDDVVYSTSPDFSRLEYISPASSIVFGHTPEKCCEGSGIIGQLVVPEDAEKLAAARRLLAVETTMEVRYRIRRSDGVIRWVVDRAHMVMDGFGNPLHVSGLVRDISATVEAEASLRLRERALESSSCGVVITDMLQPDQPILYVNAAFERITGYSAEEVMGRNCKLLQGDSRDGQQGLEEIRAAIAHGRECKVVIRNYHKDGEPFWNELQLSPLHDENGRITHYIGVQNDISANISATQALVESEHRLALTIDALHEGVWDWSVPEDSLFTSPSWSSILRLDPVEVAAEPFFARFIRQLPEDWSQRVLDEIRSHIAGSNDDFYMEHEMLRGDGSRIWVANHGRVVDRAHDGSPLRMVGTIVDITQRIESSQQIIGLMRQLDAIFTLSPDAFAYFNEDGLLSFVNPAFERMVGIQSGDVSGISLSDFRQRLQERADPAQIFPDCSEATGSEQDGQLLYLIKPSRRVLLISRRGGNDGTAAVVYLRDVTRETEVDRMKSEFLSTAAHELRTPMASIMGFAELLMMRDFGPERTKDMLGTMHRQARRLTDLINELLDLARIESRAGKDFKIARHPLGPVIRDAVAALQVDGDRSRMQLEMPDNLPDIDIDPAKMQQAVINLLSNAYKYSPAGGAIDISVQFRDKAGGQQIGVRVRDHGIGMSPEETARVFERFFRADPSGNIPGTGLGMSLVKEIMDTHGGSVELESAVGVGTTVSLWLPLHAGAKVAVAEVREQPALHGELTLWLNEPGSVVQSHQIH